MGQLNTHDRLIDGATFAWVLRDVAVGLPNVTLSRLDSFDHRLQACLDGVRLNPDDWWARFDAETEDVEAGELFVATVMALEPGSRVVVDEIVQRAAALQRHARGITSALGWIRNERSDVVVRSLLASASPECRTIGIGACAIRRVDPGPVMLQAARDSFPRLRRRALRAIGELGLRAEAPVLRSSLDDEDLGIRLAAAESAALLVRDSRAIAVLKELALCSAIAASARRRAISIAVRASDHAAAAGWQQQLAGGSATIRESIFAAGALGDSRQIPALIEIMALPRHARAAGEAFTLITGADLEYRDLDGPTPRDHPPLPSEDPADEVVELDPDENLPWPDVERLKTWWTENRSRFTEGPTHLAGHAATGPWLEFVLRAGHQRQRFEASIARALETPGAPTFNIEAPAFEQVAILGPAERVIR